MRTKATIRGPCLRWSTAAPAVASRPLLRLPGPPQARDQRRLRYRIRSPEVGTVAVCCRPSQMAVRARRSAVRCGMSGTVGRDSAADPALARWADSLRRSQSMIALSAAPDAETSVSCLRALQVTIARCPCELPRSFYFHASSAATQVRLLRDPALGPKRTTWRSLDIAAIHARGVSRGHVPVGLNSESIIRFRKLARRTFREIVE